MANSDAALSHKSSDHWSASLSGSSSQQPLPRPNDVLDASNLYGDNDDDEPFPNRGSARSNDDDETSPIPGDERNAEDDGDSTFEEDSKSTCTFWTEVKPLMINEREYKTAFEDRYPWTPTDEKHCEVMDMRHEATTRLFGGKLCQAPITEQTQNVLDIGTGTGIWAIDFADNHPSISVVGSDISHIQPDWTPPNLRFELDDCHEAWSWKDRSFDYVHVRQLTGSISNWVSFFREAHRCLTPGGYLESHEQSVRFRHDGRIPDALEKWNKTFQTVGDQLKCSFTIADGNTQMESMKEAGFTILKECRREMPVGSWGKDENLRITGSLLREALLYDLEGLLNHPAHILGWSRDELIVLLAYVRDALRSKELRLYVEIAVVVGQKKR